MNSSVGLYSDSRAHFGYADQRSYANTCRRFLMADPYVAGGALSEAIALAEARGSTVTRDEGFMRDLEEGIASRSQPWTPPDWE